MIKKYIKNFTKPIAPSLRFARRPTRRHRRPPGKALPLHCTPVPSASPKAAPQVAVGQSLAAAGRLPVDPPAPTYYSNAPSGRPARVRALCSLSLSSALALAAHRRAAADGRRSGSALPSALHLTAPARPARRRRRRVPSRIGRRGASVGSRRVGLPQRRVARVPSRRASSLLRPPPTATGGFPRARARARPSWGPGGQRLGEARGGRRRRR
jgi:hypothetical protein